MDDQVETWESPLIQLGNLLQLHSIAVLAEAIEELGIFGWDRFGRLRNFPPKSKEAERALDFLADQYRWEIDYHGMQSEVQSPFDSWDPAEGGPPAWGWKHQAPPDFKALSSKIEIDGSFKNAENSRGMNPKGQNYNLRIIGALVGFIKGNISPSAHPDFDSRKGYKGIAELISNKYEIGSQETLAKRLSEGEKTLKEAMED